MSSEIAIKVENLSKCYQIYEQPRDRLKQALYPKFQKLFGLTEKQYFSEFWALRDISFEVKKGESVGIIGRNGSGKSTLLQIITGTLSASTGKVTTQGRIAALLELGSGFDPDFTGRENVYLNGALLGISHQEIDARFDSIAAFADIGEHLDQPVKTYSSGMLVRLAFAVQVQVEPDILIVDEALAVGDALFQKRCFQRIERLVSNGTTVLFVSHEQESVRTLTNRALLLKDGRSRAWGLSSDVVLEYRRLLHEEETTYLSSLANEIAASKSKEAEENIVVDENASRSEKMSFGDGGVKILSVHTLSAENQACNIFYPGQDLKIKITCQSSIKISNLNVAVRIRNKEGVKIYSWGTLNQDMAAIASGSDRNLFWNRHIKPGEQFEVILEAPCNLGANLYEIQAAISHENTPDYQSQRMLHWVDEAAFFQVMMMMDKYFFGGVSDLKMNAKW
ncbi:MULTISPECIES: ABC transporter ATP-binding protein [unclassified Pseudomonas]|uniref:ABC transporter ATP-binding protein n=1 Tax=unclassified Pseudomonas TaxID=196821 RepID=UPI00087672A8|nr:MULTISPECIES: ABC transporter ATP-binding protein [unclassified Pseudomonas]SCZ75397.1 lipopolysaccharide transport system ATP-binding protein [Pseudomonas sp. NFPP17]SDA88638.1 lipopolysaccharide transport system ATP-binding protein [Pseudomonas sp. NFPP15]SEL96799.1 lipopolysaccharide transport system ATP-binding protein [Pseudomonas sp. NFPP18]SFA68098.1 lipopolysaccharide transport system ATP-binding protein [Pseudomonas sp. NFPP13]SFU11579.1 lipopolysaccharide transport system ATP-bind